MPDNVLVSYLPAMPGNVFSETASRIMTTSIKTTLFYSCSTTSSAVPGCKILYDSSGYERPGQIGIKFRGNAEFNSLCSAINKTSDMPSPPASSISLFICSTISLLQERGVIE
jgi:hypothetical protein